MVQKEKEYSFNLEGLKEKVNTFVGIKGNVRFLVPSLLIKLSLHGHRSSLAKTH